MPDEDARWMSYEALAQARGTTKRAAVVLVRRKRWPRQTNNAGHVTALVPATWAEPREEGAVPGHSAPNGATHAITVLESALEALREAHAGERAALQAQLSEAQAAVIRAELAAATAAERLQQMEQADAHRRSQGRWARLRAAWRGE